MKRAFFFFSFLFFLPLTGCVTRYLTTATGDPKWGVDVTWHGHSCFSIRDSVGRTIVIDPFDDSVGYGKLDVDADALLITHNHFDHNYKRGVHVRLHDIDIVQSTGTVTVASGLQVTGLTSYHDEQNGEINGPNILYTFVLGGLRFVHMGDFGEKDLSEYQRDLIGPVDVLMIPVGGHVTIDAARAKHIVDELKPRAVFPMHYGNLRFFKFDPVEDFTTLFSSGDVTEVDASTVRLKAAELGDSPHVYILSPSPADH